MTDSHMVATLRERRAELVRTAETIATRAHEARRDLTDEEARDFDAAIRDVEAVDKRLEELRASDDRAQSITDTLMRHGLDNRRPSGEVAAWADDMRSMLLERNPRPVDLRAGDLGRHGLAVTNPGLEVRNRTEQRDVLTSGPANYRPVSVYSKIFEHAVEASGVLAAGATVITTEGGETLHLPKSTALSTAAIVSEGSAIGESDPTLSTLALGSYKYGCLVQASTEMLQDTSVDIVGYLARETGLAIGTALATDLVTGNGTGKPRGVALDASAGVAPTGTAAGWGTVTAAGNGTDVPTNLAYSLTMPYLAAPAAGFLMKPSTLAALKNLKAATTGAPIGIDFVANSPWPYFVDSNCATFGNGNKVAFFGDWSRYAVRIAGGGIRFEASSDYAFNADLVTYRCLMRVDAGLVNTDAIKTFTSTT